MHNFVPEQPTQSDRAERPVPWKIHHDTALFTALLIGVSALPAEARVSCSEGDKRNYHIRIEEENSKPVIIESVELDKFTVGPQTAVIHHKVFDALKSVDVKLGGVNYSISDEEGFITFIENQIERGRKQLHLSFSHLSELTPKDVVILSAYITQENLSYGYTTRDGTRVNRVPLDRLLTQEGVCRHYAALFEAVAEKIVEISHSPYVKNFFVDEVSLVGLRGPHASNIIGIASEDDKQVNVKVTFVDTSIDYDYKFKSDQIDVSKNAYKMIHSVLPAVSQSDTFDLFRCFIDRQRDTIGRKKLLDMVAEEFERYAQQASRIEDAHTDDPIFSSIVFYLTTIREQAIKQKNSELSAAIEDSIRKIYLLQGNRYQSFDARAALYEAGTLHVPKLFLDIASLYDEKKKPDQAELFRQKALVSSATLDIPRELFFFYLKNGNEKRAGDVLGTYEERLRLAPINQQIEEYRELLELYSHYGNRAQYEKSLEYIYQKIQDDRFWREKLELGEFYAQTLGEAGNIDGALRIYHELRGIYEIAIKKLAISPTYKKEIYENGEFIVIEPYSSDENYNRYIQYRLFKFNEEKK